MSDVNAEECRSGGGADDFFGLRVASIFIILVGSSSGALFPVLARRSSWLHVPKGVFDFAKYFGSGVIIATAFIHLLSPALDALSSQCLAPAWSEYPYALALCLLSIFSIFIIELIAFRWGTSKLKKIGVQHDPHGHNLGGHAAHGPESAFDTSTGAVAAAGVSIPRLTDDKSQTSASSHDLEEAKHNLDNTVLANPLAQVIGIAILEFGVALHSTLIGLTLAVDPDFKVLFTVLIFHQTFEGLGIGTRLAYMRLPAKYNWVPIAGAALYGITTPIGIAVGLGVRTTYNPGTATASIVSGVLDSLSSGILIYTGLVELLAHEFLFNKEMMDGSNMKIAYAVGSMLLGCALMALLGRWA
ncbi:hypothetical protein DXG03_007760 [Asterophora parasitica]|uniref:ZIP-like iron-zinc transporter n=1 Tax=Asterophora parasitica TaxID=117018 RepID=A0A9P7KHK5_9AGAR|nr:hypothetical protein DXG03_007760 [Asterophora parasitica]